MSEQSRPGRKPRVTDAEIIAVLRESTDPVLSTAEVAGELPIKRRATLTRLQHLAEDGVLARKRTGGRNTVWWLADEASEGDAAPEARLKRLSNELGEPVAVGEQVYESGDAHALDASSPEDGHESPDDRTAVEERPPEGIIEELEAFLTGRDAPDAPLPSAETVRDDYHAHRHRENLDRLAHEGDPDGESE